MLNTRTASFEHCSPSDQLDRPVSWKGQRFTVVSELDTTPEYVSATPCPVNAKPWPEGAEQIIDLAEAVPLCCDCHTPLERSASEGPGTCRNAACFLFRGADLAWLEGEDCWE